MPQGGRQRGTVIHQLTNIEAQCYLNNYPDLIKAFGPTNLPAAKSHWLNNGHNEGRTFNCPQVTIAPATVAPLTDVEAQCYLNKYPDLIKAFGQNNLPAAKSHWLTNGHNEGRTFNCPAVDTKPATIQAVTIPRITTKSVTTPPVTAPPIFISTQSAIQIVPLPNNLYFTSNVMAVNGINNNNNNKYTPNGTYIISASSYSNINTQPFMAFNGSSSTYWQCDISGNPNYNKYNNPYPIYIQNPYTSSNPSSYQGGGNGVGNTWITNMKNGHTVKGEWLQIQIPYKIYLYEYSILTPLVPNLLTFPVKFMVVGSNDGTSGSWEYIDKRNLYNNTTEASKQFNKYDINAINNFSYYRLIISELNNNVPYVQINQWNLYGVTDLTINQHMNQKETFTTLNREFQLEKPKNSITSDFNGNKSIYLYDLNHYNNQYTKWSSNYSKNSFIENNINEHNEYSSSPPNLLEYKHDYNEHNNNIIDNTDNTTLYTNIFFVILATSIVLFTISNK